MDPNKYIRATRSSCKQIENVSKLSINKVINNNNGDNENVIENIDNRFITTRAMSRGASQRASQKQKSSQQHLNKGNILFDFEELDADMRTKLDKNHREPDSVMKLTNPLANSHTKSSTKATFKSIETRKSKQINKNINCNNDDDNDGGGGDGDDNDRLSLSSWGLPELVLKKYSDAGIKKLFPWQADCLCSGKVLERGNLVYSAPTSAGKTMVAELLMLKSVVETKSKALFIFPFVSVAREKCQYLQKMFQDAGVNVGGFFGGSSPAGGFASVDIAVCTIEKANNLINKLLEDGGLNQLGCVVVDELHMVGDHHRGYLLELLVTKIRYVSSLPKIVSATEATTISPPSIQIIGMSATLPNLNLLATWLDADLFTSDFRPVPLMEMLKVGVELFNQGGSKLKTLEPSSFRNDEDHVTHLCAETVVEDKCSVLVFCPTKNWCEKLADTIAREFYEIIIRNENVETDQKLNLSEKDLSDVLELLRRSPSGLDPTIGKMIRCGVAFHHAGLTFEERDIIEGAFRTGSLKVLVATSTLSSGVNLPARRVIVRSPMFNGSCIDALVYKQMIGRAGRKGVDIKGESILICKTSERKQGFDLLNSKLPPISSCLHFDPKMGLSSSMKRAILEIIVSKLASKMTEVELYARCTMLAASLKLEGEQGKRDDDGMRRDMSKCPDTITACIDYLVENEFIQLVKDPKSGQDMYVASQLGQAVVSSGFSPEEGLKVFVELQRSSRCFVLQNDLHLVYLVTPVYMLDQFSIDWYHYLCLWEGLNLDLKRVGEVVGVTDRFISKAVGGKFGANGERSIERMLSIHKRFYMSLALFDLINESPLTSACTKFKVNKGSLQALQQSSSTFAGMITSFVSKLGWRSMEALLIHFQSRLSFGVHQELVDLVRIPVLTAKLARCFYVAGYVNVSTLALASVDNIVKLLRSSNPFLSMKKAEDESKWEQEERMRTSRCIFVSGGGQGLTEREAAEEIISEAKRLMTGDLLKLGIKGVVPMMSGAKEGGMDDEAPVSKKAKLKVDNDSQKSNVSVRRGRPAKKSQTSKTRKSIRPKISSQTTSKNSLNESGSFFIGTSILTPPRSLLDQQIRAVGRDKQGSIKMRPADKFNSEVEKYITTNDKTSDLNSTVEPIHGHNSKLNDVRRKDNNTDKDLQNSFTIDSTNVNSVALMSSTPKSTKKGSKFFNPFVLSSNEKDTPVKNKKNFGDGLDVDMNVNIPEEIVFNTEDFSQFSQNDTQFLLIASEKAEIRTNVLPDKNVNKNLHLKSGTTQPNKNDQSVTLRKKDAKKFHEKSNSITFNDEILAGSQILEEFMQNTFDSSGRYLGSTSTTKFPAVSTPKGPESARRIKNLEIAGNSKSDSFVEIINVSKQYCQVVSGRSASRNGSERIKRGRLDDLKVDKSPKRTSSNSSLYESKQYCSLNFENQVPFSEELLSDFEVRPRDAQRKVDPKAPETILSPKNAKPISNEMLNQKKEIPVDLDISGCFLESSFEEDHVNHGNAFTKLKPISDNSKKLVLNSKNDIPTNSKKIPDNNNPESKMPSKTNSEALFESSELFNSFFEHSIEFPANPTGDLRKVDPKAPETNLRDPIIDNLITATAAAQFADSIIFDDIDLTQNNNPKKREIIHSEINLCTSSPKRDVTSNVTKESGFFTGTNLCRTPGSAFKKFKSHDEPITPSRLDPDMEFVMKVFCDEDDKDKAKKWNKKAPKRINSSNINADCSIKSSRCGLSKILQSPLNDKEKSKTTELHNGLKTITPSISAASHSNLQTSSKGPVTNNIDQDLCNNNVDNNFDTDDVIPPTPPGSPERLSSKAFCSGTTTPRRLLVGVVRPSPRASQKRNLIDDLSDLLTNDDVIHDESISIISSKKTSRRLDMDSVGKKDPITEVPISREGIIPSTRGPPSTLESFTICDVASNSKLFETFLQEWKTKSYFSICLACDRIVDHVPQTASKQIGDKFRKKDAPPKGHKGGQVHEAQFKVHDSDLRVVGLAVSWSALDVYYVSLLSSVEGSDLDRSMAAPDLDSALGVEERLRGVKGVLEAKSGSQIIAYDAKAQYKALSGSCGILPSSTMIDPKVACWLLDPGSREKTLHGMVATSCPHLLYLLEDIESTNGISSLGMMTSEVTSSRLRSCLESLLARHVMDSVKVQMMKRNKRDGNAIGITNDDDDDDRLWKAFVNTEMPVVTLLAKMELNGMGFDNEECESQKALILNRISTLESSAYELAGQPFSLTSPDDVSRILFVQLGLPPSGEPGVAPRIKSRSNAAKNPRSVTRFSSAKDVLEKLTKLHPIAGVILEWRKLTTVVAKMVFPLQRAKAMEGEVLKMNRIHGIAETHTATGRVSMRDPNLQNIPKDFSVAEKKASEKDDIDELINESFNYFLMDDDDEVKRASDSPFQVSMRSAFVPFEGGILLAADYSQLELRIIAHMSGDQKLIGLLNRGGDIFRAIAAQLKGVTDRDVTDEQRQHAKQICYGMIYGIGPKSLGQQLDVDEETAANFIESFKSTYSGIRTFLSDTVERCRRLGFVETMAGRRRYLPSINDERVHLKSHAERQSINTTIQGSAADIVKSAMLAVEERLVGEFKECKYPHRHFRGKPTRPSSLSSPRGAYLILQLHDELIYEVNARDLPRVAQMLKRGMEEAATLSVVLPVKLKMGMSWGKMSDYSVS